MRAPRARIRKVGPRWIWDCFRCQAGEPRRAWADAMTEAHEHLRTHRTFGFQGGQR
jgi:hypothetical protein